MWDIRHLGKWVNGKIGYVYVVHVGMSCIQRDTGSLDVWEFGKQAEVLVDQIDELVRVKIRKGWRNISHWREFME